MLEDAPTEGLSGALEAATPERTTRGEEAYLVLRQALIGGRFLPGEKIKLRALASALGMSVTPVREAIYRLMAEGALEGEAQRSVRVPQMTRNRIMELRDIRLTVEGLAAARAAERATAADIRGLRLLALEIMAARQRGDIAADVTRITAYQFALYRLSGMPTLVQLIENLWLQTGPCLALLFPGYIGGLRQDWRGQLSQALEARDPDAARRAVESDIGPALQFIADLAGPDGIIEPKVPGFAAGSAPAGSAPASGAQSPRRRPGTRLPADINTNIGAGLPTVDRGFTD